MSSYADKAKAAVARHPGRAAAVIFALGVVLVLILLRNYWKGRDRFVPYAGVLSTGNFGIPGQNSGWPAGTLHAGSQDNIDRPVTVSQLASIATGLQPRVQRDMAMRQKPEGMRNRARFGNPGNDASDLSFATMDADLQTPCGSSWTDDAALEAQAMFAVQALDRPADGERELDAAIEGLDTSNPGLSDAQLASLARSGTAGAF
ncbi:MAG: hypothetical protein KGL39_09370 [Patescibacteria group bacterium]|nr:hypothetical protein [Patescibacteria group bacterium]